MPSRNLFGLLLRLTTEAYFRKVIRIRAEDSPNVRLALAQMRNGKTPTHEILCPGVLTYAEYAKRRKMWDKIRQTIGLDALFYEGAEVRLYPPDWLARANSRAVYLRTIPRKAKAMGVDPAEGGDKTSWTIGDELGVIEQISKQTPNTAMVPNETIALMTKYGIEPDNVLFDRGGGGYEHSCELAARGYPVRTIGFGESPSLDPRRGLHQVETRIEMKEEAYAYKNRRAEMFGDVRFKLLDPSINPDSYGIPAECTELMRQLEPLPLWYDEEGRMYLPPKKRKTGDKDNNRSRVITLDDLLGCSPDEADSFVLMVHALLHKKKRVRVGTKLTSGMN